MARAAPAPDLADYDYDLPRELIAQAPLRERDSSRLMVLEGAGIRHLGFSDFPSFLREGDLLVLNNSKVSALKVRGRKETGGSVEALILSLDGNEGTCLMRGKGLRAGGRVELRADAAGAGKAAPVGAKIVERLPNGRLRLAFDGDAGTLRERLDAVSLAPLPPYIREPLADFSRYQTVYSEPMGSAAAPTAGLHFTREMLERIRSRGVGIVHLTLHIGPGTFMPVSDDALKGKRLEGEQYAISEEAASAVNATIAGRGRLFAVGTTTMRALESATDGGRVRAGSGTSELFIFPGYEFRLPYSGFLTNFHLPRSTLIMLVCALAGRERILSAYRVAAGMKYRFYSFGDAMLILNPACGHGCSAGAEPGVQTFSQ